MPVDSGAAGFTAGAEAGERCSPGVGAEDDSAMTSDIGSCVGGVIRSRQGEKEISEGELVSGGRRGLTERLRDLSGDRHLQAAA